MPRDDGYAKFLNDVRQDISNISGGPEVADEFRRKWRNKCEPTWLEDFELDLVEIFKETGVPYPLPKRVDRTRALGGCK